MLDWPGRLATTLFVSGCRYRCAYCHNRDLLTPTEDPVDWSEVSAYLQRRRNWIDGVVVTGGEPTDDPDLLTLLEALRATGVEVKLDTNGSRPDVLAEVLSRGLVDHIAMDVKTTPARYPEITGHPASHETTLECLKTIIDSGTEHEFRTTVYPGAVALANLPEIARSLTGARRYVLQQFRPRDSAEPAARGVAPYADAELHDSAERCRPFVDTSVRGASSREATAA